MTAISFSGDGKLLGSFSLEENTVRFWQPSTTFLGAFASTLGSVMSGVSSSNNAQSHSNGISHYNHVPSLTSLGLGSHVSSTKSFRTFSLGPSTELDLSQSLNVIMDTIRLEWTGERSAKLLKLDGSSLHFTI